MYHLFIIMCVMFTTKANMMNNWTIQVYNKSFIGVLLAVVSLGLQAFTLGRPGTRLGCSILTKLQYQLNQ